MATSAQRQVGCTDSLCLTPGNNTSCFSLWNANPIFSPLLTPLETQRTHWMFSHLAVVLPPLLPPPPPTHTHTHTHSVFSESFMRCINYAPFASIPPSLSLFKRFKRLLSSSKREPEAVFGKNSYCILTTYTCQILTTIKRAYTTVYSMQIKHSNIKTHGLLWWMEIYIRILFYEYLLSGSI